MALFENFPYTNFHELNLDWIIKIAKDFLDQYTHIQQIIEDGEANISDLTEQGLQELQEKATNLEALLQAWYDTHSQDIANQLADALADLNEWYEAHEAIMYQYINTKVAEEVASQYEPENVLIDTYPNKNNPAPHVPSSQAVWNFLKKRRIITCGDSYLMDYTFSWGHQLQSMLGMADADFFYGGLSGGGFISDPGGGTGNGYLIGIRNIENDISDKETITDIIVCGGLNDSSFDASTFPVSDFDSHVADFINYCKTTYPNAKIWIGYCGNAVDPLATTYLGTRTIDNRIVTMQYYSRISNNVNIAINTDIWKVFTYNWQYFNNVDYLHPNTEGSVAIAKAIMAWMNGCPVNVKRFFYNTRTGFGSDLVNYPASEAWIRATIDDGVLTLKLNDTYTQAGYAADFLGQTAQAYAGGSEICIAQTSGGVVFNKDFTRIITIAYGDLNGNQKYIPATLRFNSTKWYIRPHTTETIASGTNLFLIGSETIVVPPEYYV